MINRREFINRASAASAVALINPFTTFAKPMETTTAAGFELILLGTNWGFSGTTGQFCERIKADGYDGAEIWYPSDPKGQQEVQEAFAKNGLRFGILIGSGDTNPKTNLDQFARMLESAIKAKPLYINCHSGKDYFSFADNKSFMELTSQLSKSSGIPVYHETHRGKSLYSAPITKGFIDSLPDLRLTLDISHWCNVHESMLDDQKETIALALSRTDHIHARIGHPEGPQVNDPRAPEWKFAVDAHFAWWDKVVEQKKKEGKRMTILTEFGPPDYMPTMAYTRQPLADQWQINKYMMETLRKRYA
jgi:sugar phosphate isomerase/epimerase